jgi:hypothetical protein
VAAARGVKRFPQRAQVDLAAEADRVCGKRLPDWLRGA